MFRSQQFLVICVLALMVLSFWAGRVSVSQQTSEAYVGWPPSLLETKLMGQEQRIDPPIPVYPKAAIEAGLEGDCNVRFNVSERGTAYDIEAVCSNVTFRESAENAIAETYFVPRIVRGKATQRLSVTYPIEYRLNNVSIAKLVAE